MKLIIDIPERDYDLACKYPNALIATYAHYIKDGTPYEERPIGNWKDHRWCSNCGCGIPTDVYGTSITEEEAHFCVECGARMGVENE